SVSMITRSKSRTNANVHYKINIFVHHNKISDDKTFLSTVINSTSAIFTGR
ncbi:hypothetical protein ALC60_03769, partial [Trachymyrmex zeteki]